MSESLKDLPADALAVMAHESQKLADQCQRFAVQYQQKADKARKELKRRNRIKGDTNFETR